MSYLYLFSLLLLGILPFGTSANVMAIDFGSDTFKVAAPKNGVVDVILNELSQRKTANYIGFRGDQRYFGDEARNLAARFPRGMVTQLLHLLGSSHSSATDAWLKHLHYPFIPMSSENGGCMQIKVTEKQSFTIPELVAMQLQHIGRIAHLDIGKSLKDVMIAIPASMSRSSRRALLDSAEIAGFRVIGTIHHTTAAAMQFGYQSHKLIADSLADRGENPLYKLVIVDIGAVKTDIGIYAFKPPVKTKTKRKKMIALGQIETLTIGSTTNPSGAHGRVLDSCIAEIFEQQIMAKTHVPSILDGTNERDLKGQVALLRAASKAKEVLSVNRAVTVNIEGVVSGSDFTATLTRNEFEQKCVFPATKQLQTFLRETLSRAGVLDEQTGKVIDGSIDSFEVIGGGSRVPAVSTALGEITGSLPVGRKLNADDAVAKGATFYAGVHAHKFNLEFFGLTERTMVAQHDSEKLLYRVNPPLKHPNESDIEEGKETESPNKVLTDEPILNFRKHFTNRRVGNHTVELLWSSDDNEPVLDMAVNAYGIDKILDRENYWMERNESDSDVNKTRIKSHQNNTHQILLTFGISPSGLAVVEGAEVRLKLIRNNTVTELKELEDEEFEKAQEKKRIRAMKSDLRNFPNATAEERDVRVNATVARVERKVRVRKQVEAEVIRKLKLPIVRQYFGNPPPLSREEMGISRRRLWKLTKLDTARRERSHSNNALQSYLFHVMGDGVLENELLRASNSLNRESEESIRHLTQKISTWIDEEVTMHTNADAFNERRIELEMLVNESIRQKQENYTGLDEEIVNILDRLNQPLTTEKTFIDEEEDL